VKRGEYTRLVNGSLQLFWFATVGLHKKYPKTDITEQKRRRYKNSK